MRQLEMNEQQIEDFLRLLDTELKTNGLDSLSLVVNLHNIVLAGVRKVEKTETEEKAQTELQSER
jgi:hypothetical protein